MKKVAIIGAGFTGLTAAYELSKKGFSVTIFEKAETIGGLAGGFTIEGASLEKAYHHLFRTDTDILSLIDELELTNELGWFSSKVGMVVKNDSTKSFDLYSFNGVKDLLLYKPLPFIDRIRAGAVLFFLQKYKNWKTLIGITAQNWMTKWSGKKVMEKIWGPLLRGKFSDFSSKVSMAWLWARIHIRANSRKSIFEKELLAYPTTGFQSIAQKLAEKTAALQQKSISDVIKTGVSIEKISYPNNIPTITISGQQESFDAIISTIPQQSFERTVETIVPSTNLVQIDYLAAVVLVFTSSQSLSSYYWHNIIDPQSPFLVFLQHTNLIPATTYNNQQVYYIGVYVPQTHKYLTDDAYKQEGSIENEWFDYVKTIFPEFDTSLVKNKNLFKFSHAQHVVDVDYEAKIPPYKTVYPSTYMANFAQIFPEDRGTNYAVKEGKKIAALIEQELIQ